MKTSRVSTSSETERQHIASLESALAESQIEIARLNKRAGLINRIIDSLPAMIGYVDLNQEIVFANKHIESWYGETRETLTGMRLKDLFSDEHYRTVQDLLDQVLSGKEVNKESEITYPDGIRRHVHLIYIPDTVMGDVKGYFFLVRDISKRKLAEEELKSSNELLDYRVRIATEELELRNHELTKEIQVRRQTEEKLLASQESLSEALESMTDGFMLFDNTGMLVTYNEKVRELFPGLGKSLRPGASFRELIRLSAEAGDVKEAVGRVEDWVEQRMSDYPSSTGSVEVQLADGRWILATDRPTRSQGVVGLRTDITARKKTDEKLQMQQEQMASVLRRASMGEMASTLAHEISQPLAAISNYCQGSILRLESKRTVFPEVMEALEKTAREAERAKSIIRHVGEFVRQSTPAVKDYRLSELIDGVLELAAWSIKRNGILCQVKMPGTPVTVTVNRIEIEQVLFNLIRNSIDSLKQSPDRNRQIDISVNHSPNNRYKIAVTDNGGGIDRSIRKRIFEPYVTSKESGLGMGLSISRTIVRSHGGNIWIEEGVHNRFSIVFTLPKAKKSE